MSISPSIILAIIWGASFVACFFFALDVLRSSRSEQSIAAWILLFLILPPAGVALYLLLGHSKLRRRARRKPLPHMASEAPPSEPISIYDAIIRSHGLPAAFKGNKVTFCGTGTTACKSVWDLIDGAERSLWVSVYILGADEIGQDIVKRLAKRAAEGIEVKLLVDDLGSADVRDPKHTASLAEAGGKVSRFMPISMVPKWRRYANMRNHRKIIVADGVRAWSGGMNLAQQYLGEATSPGFFHDLSFVIEGPAAAVYARVFAADWEFATGEKLATVEHEDDVATEIGPGVVQIVPAGPEVQGDSVYDVILTMVNQAERRLWVVSPYFIPDVGLLRAFRLAARRGVDVRFLTDYASDLPLIDFAGIPYLRALASVGGRVLRFREGMIHAKALVIDDRLAIAGTTNLDQRSLFLNFEVMALFYDPQDAREIARWIEGFFERCTEDLPKPTPARQVAEGMVRLFAPVL